MGLTLELVAGLLPHSHKGNTRLFCTFSLTLHFPKEKGGGVYLFKLDNVFKMPFFEIIAVAVKCK